MKAYFVITSGRQTGRRINIPEKSLLIGRERNCNIRLASPEVSREHCRVFWKKTSDGEVVMLEDLQSENGTLVNDDPAQLVQLKAGDRVQVGPMEFEFVEKEHPSAVIDDNVLGWLSESGERDEAPVSDSTIIPGHTRKKDREVVLEPPAPPPAEKTSPVDPIVVEAGRIIRAYWASQR